MPEASSEKLMGFFNYEHLSEPEQKVAKPFADLARLIHDQVFPDNIERHNCLRKLLESKDSYERAAVLNRKRT